MKKLTKRLIGAVAASVSAFAIMFAALPVAAVSTSSVAFEKSSLSQYTSQSKLTVREQLLWGFESTGSYYTRDSSDSTQGSYSGKVSLGSNENSVYLFDITNKFSVNASNKKTVTFKLDIWVNNMSLLSHDHEAQYPQNDYSHFGTVFWRLKDRNGRVHCINTSISDNDGRGGWQTIEFSLLHDNGMDASFDYSDITGSFLFFSGKAGLVVRADNLRACYYSNTGYSASSEGLPSGCRLVSRCDADALDGAVITEWYGGSFDFTNKKFGSSCLAFKVCSVDDYRIFFGEYDFSISQSADYLCFWFYQPQSTQISSWFLEANKTQDNGNEFENPGSSAQNITKYAVDGLKTGQWNLIQLPLSALKNNNGGRDSLSLEHLRMVLKTSGTPFTVYFDNIYFCNAAQAKVAADEYREMMKPPVSSAVSSKPVSSTVSSKPVSSVVDSNPVSSENESEPVLSEEEGSSEEEQTSSEPSQTVESLESVDSKTAVDDTSEVPSENQPDKGTGIPTWGYIAIAAAAVAVGAVVLILVKKRRNTER